MTLANRITLIRALLALVVFLLLSWSGFYSTVIGLAIFIIASLTDWVDGKIARSTGTQTPFGAVADPFVDKILVLSCLFACVNLKELNVPLWAVFFIMIREMAITSLRVLSALTGEVLAADRSGKFKAAFQMVCLSVIMAIMLIHAVSVSNFKYAQKALNLFTLLQDWPYTLTVAMFVVTWWSGLDYLYKQRAMLRKSWSITEAPRANE